MTANEVMSILGPVTVLINSTVIILTLRGKRSLLFTITIFALFTAMFFLGLEFILGELAPIYGGLFGLAFLPLIVLLFEGKTFHKAFAFSFQFLLTSLFGFLSLTISGLFINHGENLSAIILFILLSSMLALYVIFMVKFGRRFFKKLFEHGSQREWAFYSFGTILAIVILSTLHIAPLAATNIILIGFLILWSFIILCVAIINANDRAKHKYEAEFARDIISSGSGHYQTIDKMHEELRVMRHDYKYHLNTIRELLHSGDSSLAEKYMNNIEAQFSDTQLPDYCSNSVFNALIAGYSERCKKLDIKLTVDIFMPNAIIIPNYEMCIILGNLLENSVEASAKKDSNRKIELLINTQEYHLAVIVKNSFTGKITAKDGWPASSKKNGGLGLRSVQVVAARYGGDLMLEWDDEYFTAYVLLKK